MPKAFEKHWTRSSLNKLYGGSACQLNSTDPPTYQQVISYYYFLSNSGSDDIVSAANTITENLLRVWSKINSCLPLLKNDVVLIKVKRLLKLVKCINNRKATKAVKENLDAKLENLFDIAACQCSLDIVPCNHPRIQCQMVNCKELHRMCICPEKLRVPLEERNYLKDQRVKVGAHGKLQMSTQQQIKQRIHQDEIAKSDEEVTSLSDDNNNVLETSVCSEVRLSTTHYLFTFSYLLEIHVYCKPFIS